MAKKVLIISTSARRNSNSDILADALMNGAKNAGNEVEKVQGNAYFSKFGRRTFMLLTMI